MSEKPTLESAWASFETDMRRNGFNDAQMETIKLIFYCGAMAMGIVSSGDGVTTAERLVELTTAIHYVAKHGNLTPLDLNR
jgi:hypothetical protein